MWRARDVLGRNVKLMRKSPLESHQTQLVARNFSFGTFVKPINSLVCDCCKGEAIFNFQVQLL